MMYSNKRQRPESQGPPATPSSGIACKRCRSRKVKCDGQFPACSGCLKVDASCIVADWSTPREYTRREVHELELKVKRLEALLSDDISGSTPRTSGSDNLLPDILQQENLSHAINPISQPPATTYHAPHRLPPNDIATTIIEEYFREFHIAHPFLDHEAVLSTLESLPADLTTVSRPLSHQLFKLNMVLALGSIRLFRMGTINFHPFGFFTAALEANPPYETSFDSLDDIENFLLIAYFGVYYNIGCSIWEIARLCIRIAIELNLHQPLPGSGPHFPVDMTRSQIVLWECYILDRFSSRTLGRPFAIEDAAIKVPFPIKNTLSVLPTQLVVFDHLVSLSQLISKICSSIHHGNLTNKMTELIANHPSDSLSTKAAVFSRLRSFMIDLRFWRRRAPVFDQPSCLFETQEFFDLSYQETKLWLFRGAIGRLQHSDRALVQSCLLRPCQLAASRIIETFKSLRSLGLMTFTRANAHLIFVSSLVVVLVAKFQAYQKKDLDQDVDSEIDAERWIANLEDSSINLTMDDALDCMNTANDLLSWLADHMSDVGMYTEIFKAFKHELERTKQRAPVEQLSGSWGTDFQSAIGVSEPPICLNRQLRVPSNMDQGVLGEDAMTNMGSHAIPDAYGGWSLFDPAMSSGELFSELFYAEGHQTYESQTWQTASWPFSVTGMEGFNNGISEYIWDMIPPWQGSPAGTIDPSLNN